ncbi:Ribosomal RNA-processing protein 17 [Mycena sanguinolenta]|uniref:Ribosomal RNA-processing protein 17 n=1 Tax=Mycena sanguinolenta TaxID=230812 RepID=A0A8H6ZF27_9AGAR|nr:Ribosomal RNA-processing protein 17 [Mycena sanguinolenta]
MTTNNLASLTRSHAAIAAKKRAKSTQIKEILFDEDARREFLTGFHKRKSVSRRDVNNVGSCESELLKMPPKWRKAYGATVDDDAEDEDEDDEWTGISGATGKGKGKQMEEEYEDEDMLATVTVVEDFDPDAFIHGPRLAKTAPTTSAPASRATVPTKSPQERPKKKLKPKKIRYETKDARKMERTKQRARRTEKAELAGGKESRRKGGLKKRGNSGRR